MEVASVESTPTQDDQPSSERTVPTTTISTISVHSGNTKLVIALLQSRDTLHLKVLEVQPDLTELGGSVQEAVEFQQAHDEVLLQLQSKQSPVEELLRQADQLISTQRPRAEVYAAMAESLGLAWKDVNTHLEQRKHILDLNVAYQSRSEDCLDKMRALDMACRDAKLPVQIEVVKTLLTSLHDLRRLMLESLMGALQDGKALLETLKEIASLGTLDSRPDRIRTSASYAISQVEHWLEELHDRRRLLEMIWLARKTKLEQCLALALLASDLHDLEEFLSVRKEGLSRGSDNLGDSASSAELLLHEHRKLIPEAKDLQDRGLKITKATEQLVSSGHFAGKEATAQAYTVLNSCAEYLDAIDERELLLNRAITFFRSAHSALTKLDQLEVQLTTTELPGSSSQKAQLHMQAAKAIEDITTPPLQEGHSLLDIVGRGTPGTEGVKRTVQEIENRKISLGDLCTAHREENVRLSLAYTSFLEKQNELFSWLVSTAEAVLQGHQDMGSVLAMAKDFLELHHKLLTELQRKGSEINTLLLTLPPILEHMDDEQRTDVDQKVDALHSQWLSLKSMIECRIDLAMDYVKFHTQAVQLATEFDVLEEEFRKGSDKLQDDNIRNVEQKWLTIQQLYTQLCTTGNNFIQDAQKVGDPYLDIKRAVLCVETLLEHFGGRQLVVSESWQSWQTSITVEREFQVQWERNMTESTRTVDWVSKLDAQLYPVLTGDTTSSKTIARELEDKVQIVMPEVKRAQTEIELRVKTADNLAQKGDSHGQKDAIVNKLTELHNKLQVIITDYQILLQMLIAFFKNLAELEKTIENMQTQYRMTRLPSSVSEVELLLKEHEASRQAILELFKFTHNESQQIIARIDQQEPEIAATQDIERLKRLLEEKRIAWENAWTDRKLQLEQHRQLCHFDSDLQQINATIGDLSKQLFSIKGQYGESLASAKATSVAFVYFEKTISLLEVRIQSFVSTAEQMLYSEHNSSPHIERELNQLQSRWTAFHNQVMESRRLVDLSIQYFTLVEEAEEWFKEGSKLLVTIARKSTAVKQPEEATQLLNEVEYFLKPGEIRQDERIRKISSLAIELYGEERSKQVTSVLNENREMLDSFTVISDELTILTRNLKAAEEERERQKKEQEEVDANLAAAWAEAAAAKVAATVAEEARKAAEDAARTLREAAPVIHKVEHEVIAALPLAPRKEEEMEKPPTPPPKEVKYVEELPRPAAPVFTVPLYDATIPEGDKFTFECRVTGFPMPETVWHKDGISIQNNPDYQTTFDQGICTLTIEETFAEDSARFICSASNSAGTAETTAKLSVKESEPEMSPPVFVKALVPSSAKEGSTFQLECRVEGNPLPTVQWFKNDVCIDNSPDYVITYNNGEAILRFEEVFLEDQAEYVCKASNQVGSDICGAKLSVEPLEPTEMPTFVTPLSNIMARAGQKIKLECEVTGLPTPQLSWSHNGKPVKETRDIKVHFDDKRGTLVVTEAFPKDAGVYIVSAKNMAGEASSSCNVSVKGRLPTETSDSELASDMEPIKPAIQLALKDVSVFEGKRVRLDCIIIGQPEPEVIWYHNERPVKESTDFKLLFQGDRCSLVIQEIYLEDAGEYKVVAINSGGEASSKCNLTVKSVGETEPAIRPQAVEIEQKPLGTAPKFSKLLTDVLAPEGEKVVFECCVNGTPTPDIRWFLNNHEIQSVEGIQFGEDVEGNVNLTILSVSPANKGVYTVKASNACGEAKCFANLIVKSISTPEIQRRAVQMEEKPPAFKELFADKKVFEKETTKFECIVTGKPTPKVRWFFNDEPVCGKDFLVSTSGDRQVLAILQVAKEHTGKVACVAENEAGTATCVATLTVTEFPKETIIVPVVESNSVSEEIESSSFTTKRSVFMQSSSSNVTSSSISTGQTEPNVQVHSYSSQAEQLLQQVGQKPPVQVQSQKIEEFHQINQKTPIIHKQTFLTVTNGGEESLTSGSSTPVVSPKPLRKSVAPRFISPLNGKIVDQGTDVVFEGIVDGYPTPNVSWCKNGQDLKPKDNAITISWELNKVRVELKSVGVKDAGRYTCKATNPVGSASSTADLVVKKTIFPPVFGRRLQAQMVKIGERVVMEVEVTGTPDPVVTWFKDGQIILGAIPGQMFRTKIQGDCYTLIIEKATLEYSGKYMVKAVNSGGEAQSIADFLVVEPQPEQSMVSHVVYHNITESSTKKHDQQQATTVKEETVRVTTPTRTTKETGPSPIPQVPKCVSPSIGHPVTSESMTVTEMTKTEKHLSIKMERTPSPSVQKVYKHGESDKDAETAIPPKKEVEIPIQLESVTPSKKEVEIPIQLESVTPSKKVVEIPIELESITPSKKEVEVPSHVEPVTPPKKEVEIPVQVEIVTSKKEVIIPIQQVFELPRKEEIEFPTSIKIKERKEAKIINVEERITKEERIILPSPIPEKKPADKEPEPEQHPVGNEGVETESITKQSALDYFMTKLKENDDDNLKPESAPSDVTTAKLTELKSHFESLNVKEQPGPKREQPQVETMVVHKCTAPRSYSDSMSTHVSESNESPSTFVKKEEHSSFSKSQTYSGDINQPITDSLFHKPSPVEVKFPFESTSSSEMHMERSSTSRTFEKHLSTSHRFPSHSGPSLLEEFGLEPEPPPEMGYIPKSEVQGKLRLDMTSRVKQLEESHRVLSPVEIPMGAVRIFPSPMRSESQTSEKSDIPAKPLLMRQPIQAPISKQPIKKEEPIQQEVVEDLFYEEKVIKPGTGDWTYNKVSEPVKPKSDITSQIEVPQVMEQWVPPSDPVQHTLPVFQPAARPTSPKRSAEGVAMEKLWATRHTPEPLPTEQSYVAPSPRPAAANIMTHVQRTSPGPSTEGLTLEKLWTSSHQRTEVSSKTSTISAPQVPELQRSASPRPSAEGVAMEKLWTPQKPAETEYIVPPRPLSTGPYKFVKDMSPKPSMEGLAMDKIWAHKHPDSGLKKTWPPSQPIEEKPVVPWAVKVGTDKNWPPAESEIQVTKKHEEKVQVSHHKVLSTLEVQAPTPKVSHHKVLSMPEVQAPTPKVSHHKVLSTPEVQVPTPKVIKKEPPPPPVFQYTDIKKDVFKESSDHCMSDTMIQSPVPADIKHYVAEARVTHSSSVMESQFLTKEVTTSKHMETQELSEMSSFQTTNQQDIAKEPSPPVVEEKALKPSEAKKLWPPGPKEDVNFKPSPVKKAVQPKRDPPSRPISVLELASELMLEPGPPPEMGFAPPPERRLSYVETIEQSLEKGLEKEPTRHLIGAVRTMPPPPQREKSIPPPLPPKEKVTPPPLPPKSAPEAKVEIKPVLPMKKEVKNTIPVNTKPFEPFPDLEPFPFKTHEQRPKPAKCPPPPTPSKFRKGEFGGSDYESDMESTIISSKWRAYESDNEDKGYRKVIPPSWNQRSNRPKSTDPEPLPPSKFDKPPQFDGPPRPSIDTKQLKKEIKSETTKTVSKVEMRSEKVRKHYAPEHKKKHSPPALKPGSPPIFVEAAVPQPQEEPKQAEPVTSPVKVKPDSPKSKAKPLRIQMPPESGYMADTDEPRLLRQATHKSTNVKHEESSSKTTIEHTTVITEKFSHQSSQSTQQLHKSTIPVEPHPPSKLHHKHSDHKMEKKVTVAATSSSNVKKELVAPTMVKELPTAPIQVVKEDRASSLEPFPFKVDASRPVAKRTLGPPPPSPSKFIKGNFQESDYESDVEGRIAPRWRPIEVDATDPSYRPVRPVLTPSLPSRTSMEIRSPTPPTEFDNPPQFGGPPRPKFQPIEKPASPAVKLSEIIKPKAKPQKVFKPKPITPKSAPMEVIVATPAVKQPEFILQPGPPPELGYVPPPQGFHNTTQTETSKTMNFAESTEHSHRVVSVQQTTRVIKFGDKQKKRESEPKLETFPFKPETERPRRRSGPPPTMPKKFLPGEFRESDYESDYEGSRIKPKWIPGDSDTEEPQYRKVKPPPVARSASVPAKSSHRVPTPMEFDTEPPLLLTPIAVTTISSSSHVVSSESEAEQKRLQRVDEMRKRFGETTTVQTKTKSRSQPVRDVPLQRGEPPEFGFAGSKIPTSAATYVASKHMNEMTSSFKSKAQKFVTDIMTDVQSSKQTTKPEKAILKPSKDATPSDDPQAYREESRVAEYGTKHIDPDTGLIYFKYDFGYEFGIVLPGEGKSQGDKNAKRPRIETKRSDDVEFPVIHEKTSTTSDTSRQQQASDNKAPQFRPKKFTHFKSVKWEPVSESEMSEAEGDLIKNQDHKKRYSLPQPSALQPEPQILIPPASRWDQATPSPLSLSPSLPSFSPHFGGHGPQSLTPGQESTVSPGSSSWQGLSPNKAPRGRGSTPTPPSTPSSQGLAPNQSSVPRKPPNFITPLRDIAVVSGQTARFECIVQAEPPPNILWSKNGRILENSHIHQIQYRNGVCRLTIPQAFPEDAGNYTCTATNLLGTIGTSGSLQVPGERRSLIK